MGCDQETYSRRNETLSRSEQRETSSNDARDEDHGSKHERDSHGDVLVVLFLSLSDKGVGQQGQRTGLKDGADGSEQSDLALKTV